MGWVDELHGRVVTLDSPLLSITSRNIQPTCPLSSHFRGSSRRRAECRHIDGHAPGGAHASAYAKGHCTGGEVPKAPASTRGITALPLTDTLAELAAQTHASTGLRTLDAIQLATAKAAGAAAFLTNDARLDRLPGLKTLVLEHLQSRGS